MLSTWNFIFLCKQAYIEDMRNNLRGHQIIENSSHLTEVVEFIYHHELFLPWQNVFAGEPIKNVVENLLMSFHTVINIYIESIFLPPLILVIRIILIRNIFIDVISNE